jgi:hypothetical protein
MLILLADFKAERERRGAQWCKKRGVGARRKLLGRVLAPNVIDLSASQSPELKRFMVSQRAAQETLAAHCRACGGCKLARE